MTTIYYKIYLPGVHHICDNLMI
uniref:Uncharacterized protein n=1 Tax=Arundo donax TaxID=35708 RepID=A0A0A9HIZ7_ARUDO